MSAQSPIALESFLASERGEVDRALERALSGLLPDLPKRLREPVTQGVMGGGKRLRPILCVTAMRAVGSTAGFGVESAGDRASGMYDLAACLELVHAYSLMHDDLPCMDDAPLRRGRPTPHTVHGEALTMVAAAALIPAAAVQAWRAGAALGLPMTTRREIVRVLTAASGVSGMVGGQALDLLGEGRRLSRPELDRLHGMKTGALLAAALEIGAVAAGAEPVQREALVRYGRSIGLAFQVADDLLDATSDAAALGKNPSDAELDKATYVTLLGVAGAGDEAERLAARAAEALEDGGIRSAELEALAAYVVRRER